MVINTEMKALMSLERNMELDKSFLRVLIFLVKKNSDDLSIHH